MNRVIEVDLEQREIEVRKTEKQKKKRSQDAYDINDPFFQEDEEVQVEAYTVDCEYRNFRCIGEGEEEKRREEPKESVKKKEKREITKHLYEEDKLKAIEEINKQEPNLDKLIEKIVIYDVITSLEPNKDVLLQQVKEKTDESLHKRIEELIEDFYMENHLKKVAEKKKQKNQVILEDVKERIDEIKQDMDAKNPENPGRYENLTISDEFIQVLADFTENEYIFFYINLYLTQKKRVLEYAVKKGIFQQLQEYFPDSSMLSGSLGKRISLYLLKKRRREKTKEEALGELRDILKEEDYSEEPPKKKQHTEAATQSSEDLAEKETLSLAKEITEGVQEVSEKDTQNTPHEDTQSALQTEALESSEKDSKDKLDKSDKDDKADSYETLSLE
ncbi:hypothetical protein NEFER03_0657 [Nematocida sp. LUAm3]|nr:hypothetical protein NEFER03_0657 [Nematocida sp. LUAm3]KAI5175116.1 hypothetical protein NEFER02_1077 [Nematocida sp. LUAm2]KAI5178212.1 hypothetical protein NEFER01_1390 [Nematocida sp. LUAm1]